MDTIVRVLWICAYVFTSLQAFDRYDTCQFEKVLRNGWNDRNQTLNQTIISLGKTEIPKIIKNLNNPLKPDDNVSNKLPFPKFMLHRDDYIKLFAYSKYLESQHKTADVIRLYIRAYRGLARIKMSSLLPMIYRIAINKTLNESLKNSLARQIFTKKEKKLLHDKLSSVLILDMQTLIKTIRAEKKILLDLVDAIDQADGNDVIDNRHLNIFKKQWKTEANAYYSDLIAAIRHHTVKRFIEKQKQHGKSVSTATELHMMFLRCKLKLYSVLSLPIRQSDYTTLSVYKIRHDLHTNTESIDHMLQYYMEILNDNKKLLQALR